ncbi:MAG: hypothetical protein HY594_02230 [Candidatus Omnitrophica bacterium]|nr:hypothetical protein [Candidatus Omnitrophota bacterium]
MTPEKVNPHDPQHGETKPMFNPQTEVKDAQIILERRHVKDGREEVSPVLNVLYWKDGSRFVAHCLELDIVEEGATAKEALHDLVDLILHQIDFCESNNVDIFHPAPEKYWRKLLEIHMNKTRQTMLDHPPKSARDLKLQYA